MIENGLLVKYIGKDKNVIIPDGVKEIGDEAFRLKHITSVVMPDSVTKIGFGSFEECKYLESVKLSKNLVEVSPNAFSCDYSLMRIEFYERIEKIDSCSFSGCHKLKEVILPGSVKEIGHFAFVNCDGLADENNGLIIVNGCLYGVKTSDNIKEYIIPDNVKTIEKAFGRYDYTMSMGMTVVIPKSVKYIHDDAFCSLSYGHVDKLIIDLESGDQKETDRLINKVFKFDDLANLLLNNKLSANKNITESIVKKLNSKSKRVEYISGRLNNPQRLSQLLIYIKKVPLDELDSYIEKSENIETKAILLELKNKLYTQDKINSAAQKNENKELGIEEKTLADYRKEFKIAKKGDSYMITGYKGVSSEITIPGTIKGITVNIGEFAFQNVQCIKKITIEEGVKYVGEFAFSGCRNLETIYFPASIEKCDVGLCASYNSIFSGCGNIDAECPENTYIEKYIQNYHHN